MPCGSDCTLGRRYCDKTLGKLVPNGLKRPHWGSELLPATGVISGQIKDDPKSSDDVVGQCKASDSFGPQPRIWVVATIVNEAISVSCSIHGHQRQGPVQSLQWTNSQIARPYQKSDEPIVADGRDEPTVNGITKSNPVDRNSLPF